LSPDADEKSCRAKPDKIGVDNDGKPGGCTNLQLKMTSVGPAGDVATEVFSGPD